MRGCVPKMGHPHCRAPSTWYGVHAHTVVLYGVLVLTYSTEGQSCTEVPPTAQRKDNATGGNRTEFPGHPTRPYLRRHGRGQSPQHHVRSLRSTFATESSRSVRIATTSFQSIRPPFRTDGSARGTSAAHAWLMDGMGMGG